jgi:hypothetical protein
VRWTGDRPGYGCELRWTPAVPDANEQAHSAVDLPILVGLLRGGASVGQGTLVHFVSWSNRGNAGFTYDVNAFATDRTSTGWALFFPMGKSTVQNTSRAKVHEIAFS